MLYRYFLKQLAAWLLPQPLVILLFTLLSPIQAAELVGRAVLSADTFAAGSTTAQFKKTNRTTPFLHTQPVQGFSGVVKGPKAGTYLVISDNGFGSKANSPDYRLRIYAIEPDFTTGKVFPVNLQSGERLSWFSRQSFLELNDKNRKVNFPIVAEKSFYPGSTISVSQEIRTNRLLTGGDFDIESFRRLSNGSYWLGDEFGPFLLHIGQNGELLDPPILLPNFLGIGKLNFVKSPDHPDLMNLPDEQARIDAANLGGSRGFEGLALNSSGTKLYALLEGSLKHDSLKQRLLIHEFDLATKQYTGQIFFYQLEHQSHAIGELTAINDHEYIVIERDHKQGDPNNSAFKYPAQFKRIYKINLKQIDAQGFVDKELLVDLLNISDPNRIGGNSTKAGSFTFPFVTIESVLPVDKTTLLVINDNNYADSFGRTPRQVDNTEFILLSLEKPLNLFNVE
jgi:hypothetical protein